MLCLLLTDVEFELDEFMPIRCTNKTRTRNTRNHNMIVDQVVYPNSKTALMSCNTPTRQDAQQAGSGRGTGQREEDIGARGPEQMRGANQHSVQQRARCTLARFFDHDGARNLTPAPS